MKNRIEPETKREIVDFCRKLEKQFNLYCVMVRNKHRVRFSCGEAPFSLIMLPRRGDDEQAFKNKVEEAAKEHQKSLMFSRKWHCYLSCLYDPHPWFSRFADKKERFPLMDMAAGSDFISPVVYGKSQMAKLRKQAKEFFGENIISFWRKEALCQSKEKHKKLMILLRQEAAYCKERKKLLNKYEVEELKGFVLAVCERVKGDGLSFIVALDGSGRPVGRALEWYGVPCPVVCLDPHYLSSLEPRNGGKMKLAVKILEKEFPDVYAALSQKPESVLFVDDQVGYGNTAESLKRLVGFFSENGDSSFQYAAMTAFAGNNTPSWLRRREIQGLQLAGAGSLRAIEAPTPQSRRFYNRLRKIVNSWR